MIRTVILFLLTLTLSASDIRVGYNIGLMSEFDKKDLKISMIFWIDEILTQTNYKVDYIDYDSTLKIAEDFSSGKLDLVLDSAINFIKYYKTDLFIDGFRAGSQKSSHEDICVILPKSKTITDFLKLKKPIIALQKNEDIFKIYAQVDLIAKDQNFVFLEARKHSSALLKLFFNGVDAAIVPKKTFVFAKELNPQIGKKLAIVKISNIKSGAFGYFHKEFNKHKREEITKLALNLNDTVRGKQLLSLFQIDGVTKSRVSDLNKIKIIYDRFIKLKEENR